MRKAGWIIGTVCFTVIFIVFAVLTVLEMTSERVTITTVAGGDTAATAEGGAGLRISAFEGLNSPDIRIRKTAAPAFHMDATVAAYDFSVVGKEVFDTLLEVRIPYDASDMLPGEDPAQCVAAAYYNEAEGAYEPVIYDIDAARRQVVILTGHLSTYTALVFPDSGTRSAQCTLPAPAGLPDVLPDSAMAAYQSVLGRLQSGGEVSDFDTLEVGFNAMSAELGLGGSAVSLLHEAVYTNDYIAKLNDGFSQTGKAFVFAQLAVDIVKGDIQQLNTNLMKNLVGYGAGLINPLIGAASFTFDYTLGKLGDVLSGQQQKYWDGYEAWYREYEAGQAQPLTVRMYREIYRLHKENGGAGGQAGEKVTEAVKKLVRDYCGMIWLEASVPQFDAAMARGLTPELMRQITDAAYDDIMSTQMPPVFAALQKRVVFDAKMAAVRAAAALDRELNTLCELYIRETQNFEGGGYTYAGCIVRFDATPGVMEDWTFRLDGSGRASGFFLVREYLNAGMPTTAHIYASEADIAAGNVMETVVFSFDPQNHRIDINLGSGEEYRIETSNTQIHIGDSVSFNVTPFAEGYTCRWNVTDETAGYIQVPFSEPGVHTVTADVYDAQGIQVAALSAEVLVAPADLRITSSADAPGVGESFTLEVVSDAVAAAALYIEWDFGDGYTDAGYFDRYEYWYDAPGQYTVTVSAYRVTDSGEKIFAGSAQTVVNIGEAEPPVTPTGTPAQTETPTPVPSPAPPGVSEAPAEFEIYSEITPATTSSQGTVYIRLTPELPSGYRYTSYSNSSGAFKTVVTMGSYSWSAGTFSYDAHATYQVYWEIYDRDGNLVCTTNTVTVAY